MTELQRYLAEEVAEDHADGIITRREAMRRLGLLGVTGAAATALLAAAAPPRPRAVTATGTTTRAATRSASGRRSLPRRSRSPGPNGTLMGAWAPAAKRAGAACSSSTRTAG